METNRDLIGESGHFDGRRYFNPAATCRKLKAVNPFHI